MPTARYAPGAAAPLPATIATGTAPVMPTSGAAAATTKKTIPRVPSRLVRSDVSGVAAGASVRSTLASACAAGHPAPSSYGAEQLPVLWRRTRLPVKRFQRHRAPSHPVGHLSVAGLEQRVHGEDHEPGGGEGDERPARRRPGRLEQEGVHALRLLRVGTDPGDDEEDAHRSDGEAPRGDPGPG